MNFVVTDLANGPHADNAVYRELVLTVPEGKPIVRQADSSGIETQSVLNLAGFFSSEELLERFVGFQKFEESPCFGE